MDANRFDALTRRLSASGSRRTALRAVAAGVVAAALGLRGPEEAGAKACSRNRARCGRAGDAPCCSGRCVRKRGKRLCRPAPGQGICTIEFDRCRAGSDPAQLKDCGAAGGGDCHCTVTIAGYSRCSSGSLECVHCTSDATCVEWATNNGRPRASTYQCLSCADCSAAGVTTACAPSCENPCQPGGACP